MRRLAVKGFQCAVASAMWSQSVVAREPVPPSGLSGTPAIQLRHVAGSTGPTANMGKGTGGNPTPPPPSQAPKRLGTVHVGLNTFAEEIKRSDLPTLLFFHIQTHPDVVRYTTLLMDQVERLNKTIVLERMGHATTATPEGLEKIVLKLALVDVEKEPALAGRFGVSGAQFPLMFFILNGEILDRLVGMVPEAQIRDAITAFMEHAEAAMKDQAAKDAEKKQPSGQEKLQRMDNDDENVLTLLQAGAKKLKELDTAKAEYLFDKAYTIANAQVEVLKKQLGLHLKKQTPETMAKLKKDPHYNACPQALSGLALTALAAKNMPRALELCKEVREKYPWATVELREVAEAICKVEILATADYNVEKDGYQSLIKGDDYLREPCVFYRTKLKLAVAHYLEHQTDAATEECLKLIRAEPKLLVELRKGGVISGTSKDDTPARKVLSLLIESLGPQHEVSIRTRKRMAAFMNC